MIIANIIGGIGNQMFQYACARSLALRNNVKLKIDRRFFNNYKLHQGFQLNKVFNCKIDIATDSEINRIISWQKNQNILKIIRNQYLKYFRNKNLIIEPTFKYWKKINSVNDNVYLYGYWQSEKYFKQFSHIIREDFQFKSKVNTKNKKILKRILNCNSISIHIRRGDYITEKKNSFLAICSVDYYLKAMNFIKKKITNPIFFVFSDDITWVKKNFPKNQNINFVDINFGNSSFNDLRLISKCKHNIIANSSFSWWGAWLNENNNKVVISPKIWFNSKKYFSNDLLPNSWIKI